MHFFFASFPSSLFYFILTHPVVVGETGWFLMGIPWRSAARGSKEGVTFCISSRTWHKSSGGNAPSEQAVDKTGKALGKSWESVAMI